MRKFMKKFMARAKKDPKKIVYPESTEERTLKAIEIVVKEGIAKPVLLGDEKQILKRIKELKLKIKKNKLEIINPLKSKSVDKYCNELCDERKDHGMTVEKAKESMNDAIYYGTMMVHMGDADGLISGAIHSTGHTILPALKIIRTKEKFHKVSGVFFMIFKDRYMFFADAAVEIEPDAKDLADIALDTANTARRFGFEPKVAMLSFSTKGSAKHPLASKVKEATEIAKYRDPKLIIDGEIQLDAAIEPWVCKIKCPNCKLQGQANVLIFPDLNSANIGYKLATFFGKADAVGPVLQGLQDPVNDLSRGCKVQDIVDITAITVIQAQTQEE